MSKIIKTGSINFKGADGKTKSVNVVADQTTADAVAEINATKTTAVNAVEAKRASAEQSITQKGQQTLASIPDDYTELSNNVSTLKDDLAQQSESIVEIENTIFDDPEQINPTVLNGGIDTSTHQPFSANNRIYTSTLMHMYDGGKVECDDGYKFSVLEYTAGDNTNWEFIQQLKGLNESVGVNQFVIPHEGYYRSVLSKSDNTTVGVDIVDNFRFYISSNKTSKIEKLEKKIEDTEPHISESIKTSNLFDYTKSVNGYIKNQNGDIAVSGDWKTTDYIPVSYGTSYCFDGGIYFVLETDDTKKGITYSTAAKTNPYTPTNNDVKYVRFGYRSSLVDDTKTVFEKGRRSRGLPIKYGTVPIIQEYNVQNSLTSQKWVAIGDSLTEKNVSATSNYADYISVKNWMELVNMGVGGTGYMRGYDSNNAFYQRAESIPDCDIITIFGSGNDLALYSSLGDASDSGTDTICGCMNTTLDVIFDKYPTTPVLVIAPTPWFGNTPDIATGMSVYVEKLRGICQRRSVPFLDLFHESGLRPNDEKQIPIVFYSGTLDGNPDGVHPNELGHRIIAGKIEAKMKEIMLL